MPDANAILIKHMHSVRDKGGDLPARREFEVRF
jgi:hypothetical protein